MNFAHRITIERRPVFCPGIMNPALSSIARSFLMPADPYLWLEDVEGDEALAWVRARNAEKAQELSQSDMFKESMACIRSVLYCDDKIPAVAKIGVCSYKFYLICDLVRGCSSDLRSVCIDSMN